MSRRRPSREPAFGSDSFLDVVANLVGIVLIIIVLVAARIRELPDLVTTAPAPAHQLPPQDEAAAGLDGDVKRLEAELAALQQRLLETLRALDLTTRQARTLHQQRAEVADRQSQETERTKQQTEALKQQAQALAQLESEGRPLQDRIAQLQKAIQELESMPPDLRALRFHLPVSRPVSAGELLFELRGGRLTFIDLQAFLDQVKQGMPQKVEELRKQWEVTDTTEPVGPFRLRYVVSRERNTGIDRAFKELPPVDQRGFASGLDSWELVPVLEVRGETLDEALTAGSRFRQVVETTDADQVVLTFFVYTDSFEQYRQVRDYLYERGFMVAGRPLSLDRSISGSRSGTLSRGQ